MKQIIGLDIDNTLTKPSSLVSLVEKEFKLTVPEELHYDYRFLNNLGLTKEQIRGFWKKNYFTYVKQSKPADGILDLISNYVYDNSDNEVHIITARPAFLRKETELWLSKNNVNYDTLVMAGRQSKLKYIDDLNVTRMIDDSPELFIELEENGYDNKIEIVCVDQLYNQDSSCHKRISQINGTEIF